LPDLFDLDPSRHLLSVHNGDTISLRFPRSRIEGAEQLSIASAHRLGDHPDLIRRPLRTQIGKCRTNHAGYRLLGGLIDGGARAGRKKL
jgi:hypothetical protein